MSHTANMDNFNVFIDGKIVYESYSAKYVGITLQSNLSWDSHINDLKMKLAPAVGILYKLKNKLNSKLTIYKSVIETRLNCLYIPYAHKKNKTSLKSLEMLQNRALKIVYKLPLMYRIYSLYKDVSKTILPIYGLYKYQALMYVFKFINQIDNHTITFSQNQLHFNTRNRDFLEFVDSDSKLHNKELIILAVLNLIICLVKLFKISCK